jgi:hypothetical protein
MLGQRQRRVRGPALSDCSPVRWCIASSSVGRVGNEATRRKDVEIDPVKAPRKFWDRTRLREWMERLILAQAWNQEGLKKPAE